jgi:hypothetical protein
VLALLQDPPRAATFGRAGREQVIARWSIDRMVQGYEELLEGIYQSKATGATYKFDVREMKQEQIQPVSPTK